MGNNFFVNENKVSLKSYLIRHEKTIVTDSLIVSLKKLNFNCLLLSAKVPNRVYELCDRLGIYTIQLVNDSLFTNIYSWIDYHICIKEHPSLIGWFLEMIH